MQKSEMNTFASFFMDPRENQHFLRNLENTKIHKNK